jgi:outer membrane protein insertion porin family
MKAAYRFTSAVSAVALSAGLALSGAVVVQLAQTSVAMAAVVSAIEVRGNQRVDDETIRNYVGIRPGRNFSNADIDEGVKRLFGTGLFSDVRISQSGGTLIVQVDEYSIVNQVLFQGNKRLKDADLARAVQLQPRGTFSSATMEQDAEAIRAAYGRIGRDDAQVTPQVIELGESRVNVVYQITEGDRTKIAAINFEGNSAFGDRRLADVISTKRSNILSFLFRDDIYDEDRLRADEEALRRFYYNRGYADFQVISSSAELNEATNEYTVNFVVDEGERYEFGEVVIDSTIEGVNSEALRSEIKSRQGRVYSAKNVEETIVGITERVAGQGYAFAQVTPRGDRNFENRTISVVYTVDQGPRAYVERIEIRGNTRTRDYVIRREFDVSEGDAFNQVLIQRAKRRLELLDFFTSVNVSTVPGSEADQVILVVDVVEKATGEFSIGAGYATGQSAASAGGFTVQGSISERNFLGRGQFIRVSAGGGRDSRDFQFSFTEPYFLGQRIAAGFDIYRNTRNYDFYSSELTGGTVRFTMPITEHFSSQLAYNLTQEEYIRTLCDTDGDPLTPPVPCGAVAIPIEQAIAEGTWIKSSISNTFLYNTLDDIRNPREGIYANLTLEYAGLGGDANFIKATARGNYYKTLSEEFDLVGLVTLGGGHIEEIGSDGIRIFDLFKSNDRIIRGFEYNGMGPYANVGPRVDHVGGSTYVHGSVETQFPMPLLPESLGMRGAFFADAATLFGNDLDPSVIDQGFNIRASVGASLIWASPFGPLRVDYAIPVMKEASDKVQNFNFGVSTRF